MGKKGGGGGGFSRIQIYNPGFLSLLFLYIFYSDIPKMADVKTEVFECPNCCDRNNAQLLQDISILQAMIEKLKLWLGSVPREFREEEENSSEIVQSMKVWLKNIPTEFAWWTDGVGVKSEEAQHLIILGDHAGIYILAITPPPLLTRTKNREEFRGRSGGKNGRKKERKGK